MTQRQWTVLVAFSKWFNATTGGDPGETFCCRVGRNVVVHDAPRFWWRAWESVLNLAFRRIEGNHCFASYLRELDEAGGSSLMPGTPPVDRDLAARFWIAQGFDWIVDPDTGKIAKVRS